MNQLDAIIHGQVDSLMELPQPLLFHRLLADPVKMNLNRHETALITVLLRNRVESTACSPFLKPSMTGAASAIETHFMSLSLEECKCSLLTTKVSEHDFGQDLKILFDRCDLLVQNVCSLKDPSPGKRN